MKKLMSVMLGLSLIAGTAAFAQDEKKPADTKMAGEKKAKKAKKAKTGDTTMKKEDAPKH